jgi:aspartyl-tRNA synthetase
LVYNGLEIGGGSLRIYEPELQQEVFAAIRLSEAVAQNKSGFLLNAFPKTQQARCLLTQAPSDVDVKQLKELHITTVQPPVTKA